MSVLSNNRHELFAQALAQGKTATEAYELAGYKPSRKNASALKTNQDILGRVLEIQGRAAKRAEVTVESLLEEAEEIRRKAVAAEQFSAAVAAVKEKGVLSGKRVERSEVGDPGDFDRMTDAELAGFISARMARISAGGSSEGIAGNPQGPRSKPH